MIKLDQIFIDYKTLMSDQDRISLQNTKLLSITWAIYPIDLIFSSKCPRLNQSIHDLTNREALTVLCYEARKKRLRRERRVGRNTSRSRVFFPTLWVHWKTNCQGVCVIFINSRIFVPAHVTITWIKALGVFANLCLVFLFFCFSVAVCRLACSKISVLILPLHLKISMHILHTVL